jgi:hypothetical protein
LNSLFGGRHFAIYQNIQCTCPLFKQVPVYGLTIEIPLCMCTKVYALEYSQEPCSQ